MSSSEHYYNYHLRSLFISKHNYSDPRKVVKLNQVKVGVQAPFTSYSLAGIFLFLFSGVWPQTKLLRRTLKGREVAPDSLFTVCFKTQSDIFQFFNKLNTVYLPELESWAGLTDLFSATRVNNFNMAFNFKSIFYIFFELDFLVNYTFTFLKVVTNSWTLRVSLFFNTAASHQQLDLLRSLGFPGTVRG